MTTPLRAIHIAVAAFVLGVLGTSAVVLATGTSGEDSIDRSALVVTATFVRDSLYAGNDRVESTPVPALVAPVQNELLPPTAEEAPPPLPEEPLPPPEESPPPPPDPVRSCAEIRSAGDYLNETEREFFLASCRNNGGARTSAAAPPASRIVPTEIERAYRVKADGIAHSYLTAFRRFDRGQLVASAATVVEYGGIAGGWANQMDNFAPVPPRFQAAHDHLQGALWSLAAHSRAVAAGEVVLPNGDYEAQYLALADAVDSAMAGYFTTVGLSTP